MYMSILTIYTRTYLQHANENENARTRGKVNKIKVSLRFYGIHLETYGPAEPVLAHCAYTLCYIA